MSGAECKLCSRKFSNGKALGGHMRSHYATLPLPPKTPQRQDQLTEPPPPPPPTESTSSDERESSTSEKLSLSLSLSYGLRENPKKSFRLVDPEFSDVGETESTRSGCKRAKVTTTATELEMEEDVALCLVMLSRDVWASSTESRTSHQKVYKCEMCDKVFRSTQGLGSHRASHNKQMKNAISCDDENVFRKREIVVVHQCSFCDRIFRSHQALGGHKRSHYAAASKDKFHEAAATIDLNLPAAMEDEDDEDGGFLFF